MGRRVLDQNGCARVRDSARPRRDSRGAEAPEGVGSPERHVPNDGHLLARSERRANWLPIARVSLLVSRTYHSALVVSREKISRSARASSGALFTVRRTARFSPKTRSRSFVKR